MRNYPFKVKANVSRKQMRAIRTHTRLCNVGIGELIRAALDAYLDLDEE